MKLVVNASFSLNTELLFVIYILVNSGIILEIRIALYIHHYFVSS